MFHKNKLIEVSYVTQFEGKNKPVLLSWQVAEFTSIGMLVEFKFKNPLSVSRGVVRDKIKLNFIWPYFFKTEEDSIFLDMNYQATITIPFQMKSKEEFDNAMNSGQEMQTASLIGTIGGVVLIISSNVNGKIIFYLLEGYQMICLVCMLTTLPTPSKFKITLTFLE